LRRTELGFWLKFSKDFRPDLLKPYDTIGKLQRFRDTLCWPSACPAFRLCPLIMPTSESEPFSFPPGTLTQDVALAAGALRAGRLVAFATETVYGLGGHAFDLQAVARIFEAKGRPRFDPLIVHVATPGDVEELVTSIPPVARRLMERFWPGPLTLVLPKRETVPDLLTAGLPDVAVRVPDHPLTRELLSACGVPVAAPSANRFGRISPTTAAHVAESLGDRVDLILDGGPCRVGVESTVVRCTESGEVFLLRPGGISREAIEAVVGAPVHRMPTVLDDQTPQVSPGQLAQHYAPRKPLYLLPDDVDFPTGPDVGVLSLLPLPTVQDFGAVEVLSETGSLTEAAARFFAALRRLDAAPVQRLYARRFPDHELGLALNDRLQRASTK